MRDLQAVPRDALCAQHLTEFATLTCARCGNFMCEVCSDNRSQSQCPRCIAKVGATGFPLTRDSYDFGTLFSYAFEAFKREWLMLSVSALILFAVLIAFSTVGQMLIAVFAGVLGAVGAGSQEAKVASVAVAIVAGLTGYAISLLAFGVAKLGFDRLCADALEGRKVDIARMFSQLRKVGPYAVQALIGGAGLGALTTLIFAVVGLGGAAVLGISLSSVSSYQERIGSVLGLLGVATLIAIFPLAWFGLAWQNASFEVMYTKAGPIEAIRNAFTLADGHRLIGLLVVVVSVPLLIAGELACLVGVIPAFVLLTLLQVGHFLAMRNGAGLPTEVDAG